MKRNSEYIGVDEKYIPENEKYVNDSILGSREESKNKIKKFFKIGFGAWLVWFLFVAAIAIGMFIFIFNTMNKQMKMQEEIMNGSGSIINQVKDSYNNGLNQMQSQFESSVNKVEQEFNSTVNKTESGKDVTMQDAQNQIDKMQSTMDSMMDQFMNF